MVVLVARCAAALGRLGWNFELSKYQPHMIG